MDERRKEKFRIQNSEERREEKKVVSCEKEGREKKEGINDKYEHRTFNVQRSTSNKENERNEEEKRYRTPLIQ